jgi:hypothetical protein
VLILLRLLCLVAEESWEVSISISISIFFYLYNGRVLWIFRVLEILDIELLMV